MKTVMLGPHQYKVIFQPGVTIDDIRFDGYYEPDTMTIRVDDSLHISRQRETLLHEILHACWQYSYLWKMKRPDEEQVVSSLAFMLSAVLSANPWVGEFLTGDA